MENDRRMWLGPNGLINRPEFVRVIILSLYSLGYRGAARRLESESGVSHHHSAFTLLRSQILFGKWEDCAKTIRDMDDLDDQTKGEARRLVLNRWIEECKIENDDDLVSEIIRKNNFVYTLTENDRDFIGVGVTSVPGLRQLLVKKLECLLAPERRLESLVEMAIRAQVESCSYHNSADPISLLKDHRCSRDQFPTKKKQVLSEHLDEVWFVKFSNNGQYLASASKDCTAIIWKVFEDDVVRLSHTLRGHKKPVSFVSWSPNDSKLLTSGEKELVIRLWNVDGGDCMHIFDDVGLRSCAWLPDEKGIFYAKCNPTKFVCVFTFDDKRLESITGEMGNTIRDFVVTPNGMFLIIISSVKDILVRNLENHQQRAFTEESAIVSISVSENSKFLMVSLGNQELHIWDVNGTMTEPFKCRGHKRTRFIIHSCFGGFQSDFIASGSEDSQVYIWNPEVEEPLEVLAGHSGIVSCVSWNPKKHNMLASASDDFTICIWGPERDDKKQRRGRSP